MKYFRNIIYKLREYKPKRDKMVKERYEKQKIKSKKRQSSLTIGP